MDKIQIINEQFQRPETLSRIAKNQNMAREEQLSRGDQAIQNGLAVQGKALGEKFKSFMEGKDIHNDAEKTLQKSLTAGELLGRATDEKMQKRTKYKDGMYNESLDELQLLNQTEDIAATDFFNQTMSEVGTYAEQPKEVFEGKLLEYFNGIKAKYKDKPAYANALITKYSGMAQDLMSNYTKQRQAVMQRQANAASQKMKLQQADAFTGGLMAAGIDEEARQSVRDKYKASLSLSARQGESEEAFIITTMNAQLTLLDNGNIEAFKIYKDSEAYGALSDTQRTKIETAEKAYNKKIVANVKTLYSKAKVAALNGDMSLYNKILNESIPEAEARLSGHVEGYEDLAGVMSQVAGGYERQEDLRQKQLDRALKAKEMAMDKEDRQVTKLMSNIDLTLSNFEKKRELAGSPEEKAKIDLEMAQYAESQMPYIESVNDPINRRVLREKVQGQYASSALNNMLDDKGDNLTYNSKLVDTKIDTITNDVNTIVSYSDTQVAAMSEEEIERNDNILESKKQELLKLSVDKRLTPEQQLKAREKLNEVNNKIAKRDNEIRLYGKAKEGYDREEDLNWSKNVIKSYENGSIKLNIMPNETTTSGTTNRRNNIKMLNEEAEKKGLKGQNNIETINNLIEKDPETLKAMSIAPDFQSILIDYGRNYENVVNTHSESASTLEDVKKAQVVLELDTRIPFLSEKAKNDAKDAILSNKTGRPISVLRLNNAPKPKIERMKEAKEFFEKDTDLQKLDFQGQERYYSLYANNTNGGLAPFEAHKRAKEESLRNIEVKGVVNIKNSIPPDILDPYKAVTVTVKGHSGGEQNISVYDILEEHSLNGGFSNKLGLKNKTYNRNKQGAYVTLNEVKELYSFELRLLGGNPAIMMVNKTDATDVTYLLYNDMKNLGKLHSARTRKFSKGTRNSIAGFDSNDLKNIATAYEYDEETLKTLEVK